MNVEESLALISYRLERSRESLLAAEIMFENNMLRALHNYIKLTILSFRASEARHGIQYYQVFPRYRLSPV